MRLINFFNESVEPIDEAPMNPAAYAQSVEQAQAQGVLVGFEFEVCVPAATINAGAQDDDTYSQKSIDKLVKQQEVLNSLTTRDISLEDFDNIFTARADQSPQYSTAQAAADALVAAAIEKAKKIFYTLPEKLRIALVSQAKKGMARLAQRYPNVYENKNPEIAFIDAIIGVMLDMYHDNKFNGMSVSDFLMAKRNFEQLARVGFDYDLIIATMFDKKNVNKIESKMSNYFDYIPGKAYKALDLVAFEDNDDVWDDDEYDYTGAAKVLKPALESATGKKVNVFKSYHQQKKNMTNWYIEPDGSLSPDNDDDGAAEVVGPPEAPQQALASLKMFFGLAKQMNLYTNGSTGLHINVSIPKDIDVLKLAVFTGDQYVLQQFGRMNSSYAQSVTKSLTGHNAQNKIGAAVKQSHLAGPGAIGQPKVSTNIKLSAIQKIAQDISSSHTASISSNGKYVSFRQVGGDYLNDYQQIVNVVGRFVRAMVIAADPNAYRKEYLAAVAKLAMPNTAANPIDAQIANLEKNGLSTATVYVCREDRSWPWKDVINEIHSTETGHTILTAPDFTVTAIEKNSQRAKQKLIAAGLDGQSDPISAFATITAIPVTANALAEYEKLEKAGPDLEDGYFDGYFIIEIGRLPPTAPQTQQAILNLRKQRLGKK